MKSLFVVLLVAALAFAATAEEAAPVEQEHTELAPQQEEVEELPEASEEEEEEPAELDLEEPEEEEEEGEPEEEAEEQEGAEVPEEEDVEASAATKRHNRHTSRIFSALRAISRKLRNQHNRVRASQRSINRVWNRSMIRARRQWTVQRGRAAAASRRSRVFKRRYRSITVRRSSAMRRAAARTARSRRAMYKELALIKRIECMVWKLRHGRKSGSYHRCMRSARALAGRARPPASRWYYKTSWTRRVGQKWTISARRGRRIQVRTIGMCGDSDRASGPNMFRVYGSGNNFRFGSGRYCGRRRNYRTHSRTSQYWLGCLKTRRYGRRYSFKYQNVNRVYKRSRPAYVRFDYHYDWDGQGCRARAINGKTYRDPRSSIRYIVKYRYIQ